MLPINSFVNVLGYIIIIGICAIICEKYHTVETIPNFIRKIVETVAKSIPHTHTHDRSHTYT
jgi:hypothetical protein